MLDVDGHTVVDHRPERRVAHRRREGVPCLRVRVETETEGGDERFGSGLGLSVRSVWVRV